MKKIFLYSAVVLVSLSSCRKEEEPETYKEPETLEIQNSYDDQAIQKFMSAHYLDNLGNIRAFSETDATDDNYPTLSALNPVVLPSGVIYIMREGAQPVPGTAIGSSDIIRLMNRAYTYVATSTEGAVSFVSPMIFRSTIDGSGTPEVDPAYYYVKQSVLDAGTTDLAKQRSYYEIEGFREALQHFKAFDLTDDASYNLQGVIIVPSRAAFARDLHFNHTGYSLRNRSVIFNFQVYKTTPRP
jgi:hypothetical protein